MKTTEENLKELIISKYGTMLNFSSKIGMANSTLAAIISRGVTNASVNSINKICKELNISADALSDGKIIPNEETSADNWHFKDLNEIMTFVKISLSSNKELTINGKPLDQDDIQTLIDAFELDCELIRRKAMRRNL